MGNGKSTPDVAGAKKRKQEVVENPGTPISHKRVKKDVPTPKSATPKDAGLQNGAAGSPSSIQADKKDKKKRRSSGLANVEAAESIEKTTPQTAAPTVQTPGMNGEQKLFTKKQWKMMKKHGSTESPMPGAKPVATPIAKPKPTPKPATKAVDAPPKVKKVVEQAPLDEIEIQRRKAEKKARKAARKSGDASALQRVAVSNESESVQSPEAVAASAPKPVGSQNRPKKTVVKVEVQDSQSSAKWTLSDASAGRYIQHDPVFVTDSNGDEYLVAATAHEVQILSLQTSLPAYSLQTVGSATVVAFSKEPGSSVISVVDDRCYTTTWDWEQGSSNRVKQPKNGSPLAYATSLQAVSKDESRTLRVLVNDSKKKTTTICLNDKPAYKSKVALEDVHITGEGQYVVGYGPDALVVGKRKKNVDEEYTWAELPMSTKVTCAHSELRVAKGMPGLRLVVGLVNGQLHLYDDVSPIFDIKDGSKLPTPRVLHWHRDAVSSVKFSADGRYIVSGGKETVLVLWQLETGKTQFLPHLTSEVERVVVSAQGDRYAVQMGDNSIMVLSTSELKPVANFAGLQLPVPVRQGRQDQVESNDVQDTTALLHPTQPDQLLLSVPATQPKSEDAIAARPFLQAFDLRTSRHIVRQALTRNNVTDFNLGPEQTPIIPPDVCHAAVSNDGQWLATVDEWVPPAADVAYLVPDDEDQTEQEQLKRKEVYLKIWQWDATQSLWTLTTRIDAPHARATEETSGAGSIYALAVSPSSRGFATLGEDSAVKFWKPKTRMRHGMPMKDDQGNALTEWTCHRTTQLERQLARVDSPLEDDEDTPAFTSGPSDAHLAFSEDGSTLAAALTYDSIAEPPALHLIDAFSGAVKYVKDSYLTPELSALAFLDRHLLALSRESLRVWDIVADFLVYEIPLPELADDDAQPLLAVNTRERNFAVAVPKVAEKGKVRASVEVYSTEKAEVLHTEDLATPVCALLATPSKRGFVLLFADATVRTLGPRGAARTSTHTTSSLPLPITDSRSQTPSKAAAAVPELLLAGRGAKQGLVLEETEDDRPVVRPEDLAGLFDTGMGVALPSVRDMWRGVAELYGRRPRFDMVGGQGQEMEVDA